jgi:hypothetical protein
MKSATPSRACMADQDQIETSRKLAAQRQIDAAIAHLKNVEFECAITLAGAAEEMLPDTNTAHAFPIMRDHPTFKKLDWDWNEARNWLKHYDEEKTETRIFHQSEAAVIIYRAISKFFVVYGEMPNRWQQFLAWGARRDYFPANFD